MKKIFCLIVCLFLSNALRAEITATFTPTSVQQGGTVELVISSDQPFSGVPNIDILQKDFVIGGQQRKQSAKWINGKGTNVYQLIYTLFPNKAGAITVRNLKVGNTVVPPATLTVHADAQFSSQKTLSMRVDCPKGSLYPSQKLLCTVYLDDPIGLVDGQIVPPQTNLGTWTQVLPPLPVAGAEKGIKRYQSTFSFTPKQSGRLEIPPFVFQGEARLNTRGKVKYDNILDLVLMGFQSTATQPVGAQSAPIVIAVKEKPAGYTGWWLPSSGVTLSEKYQMPDTIGVGDPISRTLTLTAQDVVANDMPVPEASSSASLKVYANPAERQDTENGGQVTVTLTFVPTQAGEVMLPSIQVPWFDLQKEQIQYASVPARPIFVTGSTQSATPPVISVPQKVESTPEPTQPQPTTSIPWLWIILAISGAFLLGIFVAFIFIRRTTHAERKKKKPLPDLYPF